MASLTPESPFRAEELADRYAEEAIDIVFSLPELTPAEQAVLLVETTKSGDIITLDVAEQAITKARRTF